MTDPCNVERQLFERIRTRFSTLEATIADSDPNLDLLLKFPFQEALPFEVELNLQGDELHLTVGDSFTGAWFPSMDLAVRDRFEAAAAGILSGTHRIVEYSRGTRPYRADLEAPTATGWQRVARWSRLYLPWLGRPRSTVLQRAPGTAA